MLKLYYLVRYSNLFSKFSGSFLDFRWNFVHSMNPLPHSFTSLYCTACLDKYWYWSVEWSSLRHMQHWTMSSIIKKVGPLRGLNPDLPGGRPMSYPLDYQCLEGEGRRLELTYQTFNGFCSSLSLSLTEATSIDLWSSWRTPRGRLRPLGPSRSL